MAGRKKEYGDKDMKDYIRLKDMEIIHNHGFFQEEKTLGQKFVLDIKVYVDMDKVTKSEDLDDTINYGLLASYVQELFTEETLSLIENVGDKIAKNVLVRFPVAEAIEVIVKKPWAPVGYILERPEISINRKWERVFLGIGSNVGSKKDNLDSVVNYLERDPGFKKVKASNYIETSAWGVEDQDNFLNGAIEVMTYYNPEELLNILQDLEEEIGREKTYKWGPRVIDIDILFFGNEIIYSDDLKVPHPYIYERDFVLEPLNELAPYFIDPVSRKQLRHLLEDLKTKSLD